MTIVVLPHGAGTGAGAEFTQEVMLGEALTSPTFTIVDRWSALHMKKLLLVGVYMISSFCGCINRRIAPKRSRRQRHGPRNGVDRLRR